MKRKTIFSIVIGLVAVAMLAGLTIFLVNHQQQPQPQMESHPTQMTVKQFIKEITPAAKAEQKHYHIPASIIIAQAGIESDWGRAKLAYKYNNVQHTWVSKPPEGKRDVRDEVMQRWRQTLSSLSPAANALPASSCSGPCLTTS